MVSVALNLPATAATSSPVGANNNNSSKKSDSNSIKNSLVDNKLPSSSILKRGSVKISKHLTDQKKQLKPSRSQNSFETFSTSTSSNITMAAAEVHSSSSSSDQQHSSADNRGFFSSSQTSLNSGFSTLSQSTPLNSNLINNNSSSSSSATIAEQRDGNVVAEGMLCKYTNVVNGWKNRWFVLNKDVLEYYEKEDHKCNLQKPRGTLSIFGATVVPSDDDSLTFTVTTQGGQTLKLKASDQKERSFWISRLRQAASTSSSSSAILWSASNSQIPVKSSTGVSDSPLITPRRNTPAEMFLQHSLQKADSESGTPSGLVLVAQTEQRILSAINQAQSSYVTTCAVRDRLRDSIERLPNRAFTLDVQLLQLKANASAVCAALDQCVMAVRKSANLSVASKSLNSSLNGRPVLGQHVINGSSNLVINTSASSLVVSPPPQQAAEISPRRPGRSFTEPNTTGNPSTQAPNTTTHPRSSTANNNTINSINNLLTVVPTHLPLPAVDHDKSVEDVEKYRETGIGNVEPQRPVILQMLAELKLGMDLTRVSLPTFILEKRSLLEMFADCMGHPDLFLKIAEKPDPESRMNQALIWYLTSIHAGRQGDISKKPYNPLIGETFHCCWDLPANGSTPPTTTNRIIYTAEQVSHHPPVSAFYFECPSKGITLNGSIWTKSQFLGMSIGAQMIGQITVTLHNRGEQYTMTLPSAYARSILSYPWVELGDRCTITCPQTGYAASIVFHTKGAYGGTLHRVSGEVHPPNSSAPSLRFSGEWTGRLDFTSQSGESFSIDVTQLQLFNKRVRPLVLQSEWESRRLWQSVTQALKAGDIDSATANKKILEEQQRQAERIRKDKNIVYEAKYFDRVGTSESMWIYKSPLRTPVSERRSSPSASTAT